MTDLPDLSGKNTVVTGASRGIGEAIARLFVSLGSNVTLLARSTGDIDRIAAALNASAGRTVALAAACDVADFAAVDATIKLSEATFGPTDILINNAGVIDPIARISSSDPAAWAQVQAINVNGVYHGIRAVLPTMESRGDGIIINTSSGAATSALEGWSHYCASKAAVLSLTKCTHREAGEKGVLVVGLSPGTVATEMQVEIKASGINPVSQLDESAHISAESAARGFAYLCGPEGIKHAGGDFSLRTDEGKRAAGLV